MARICSATLFAAVTRNTPLLVQLFILYFGLPSLGIRLSPKRPAGSTTSMKSRAIRFR